MISSQNAYCVLCLNITAWYQCGYSLFFYYWNQCRWHLTFPCRRHLGPLDADQFSVHHGQHNRLEHRRRAWRETRPHSPESHFWIYVKHILRQVRNWNQGRRRKGCPTGKRRSGDIRANQAGEEGFFWTNVAWHCLCYWRKHNWWPTESRRTWSLAKRAYDCRQHSWPMVLCCVFSNIYFEHITCYHPVLK